MIDQLRALTDEHIVEPFDVEIARSLCRVAKTTDDDVARAVALLSRSVRVGHSCLPLDQLAAATDQDDGPQGNLFSPRTDSLRAALEETTIASDGHMFAPLVLDNQDRLYFRRHWEYERAIADRLRERLNDATVDQATQQRIATEAQRLLPGPNAVDQRRAVELIATRTLSVVFGGPGTGKTTTLAAGLAALIGSSEGTPPRILLAAPTGKAASRIAESVARAKQRLPIDEATASAIPDEALTLHRALRLRPFEMTRRTVLEHDVVVIDEASMVDLELMAQLLDALRPTARLVLVGDADQLASVEAGSVLRDLVEASGRASTSFDVELKTNFRFDEKSSLGQLAAAVRAGDASSVCKMIDDTLTAHEAIAGAANRWRDALNDEDGGVPAREEFTVLCPFRSGRLGTEAINRHIDELLVAHIAGARPILIEQNDHDLGVWNGDFGILHEERGTLMGATIARAGGDPIEVAAERLPPFSLAYAMTVHKAQGSEFDDVTLVLPDHDSPLLTRELLYTAVTRARRQATIVGRPETIRAALSRRATRFSGLVDAFAAR